MAVTSAQFETLQARTVIRWRDPEVKLYTSVAFATAVGHLPLTSLPFEVGAMGDGLGLGTANTGLLAMVELSVYALTNILLSPVMGRLSLRKLGVTGASLAICGNVLTACSTQLLLIGLARALVGFGFGLTFSCANAAGAKAKVPERAYAIGYGVLVIFTSILPMVLGHSVQLRSVGPVRLLPHASVFLAMAAFTAMMAPATWFLPGKSPRSATEAVNGVRGRLNVKRSAASLAIMVLFAVGVFAVYAFIERRGRLIGVDSAGIGNILSFAIGLGLVGTFASMILGRRAGIAGPLLFGLVVQGVSCVSISLSATAPSLALSTLLFMAMWGFVYPYIMGLGATIDPEGRLPTALGGSYLLGASVAAALGGALMQRGDFLLMSTAAAALCVLAGCVAYVTANHVAPRLSRESRPSIAKAVN